MDSVSIRYASPDPPTESSLTEDYCADTQSVSSATTSSDDTLTGLVAYSKPNPTTPQQDTLTEEMLQELQVSFSALRHS